MNVHSSTIICSSIVLKDCIYDFGIITIHKNSTCITCRFRRVRASIGISTCLTINSCMIICKGTIFNGHIIPFNIITPESIMLIQDSTNHNSGTFSTGVVGEFTVSYNYIVVAYSKCTTIFA